MNLENLLPLAKQIICALLSLIFPLLGIGLPETGAKAPAADTVRIMSFNVRDGEFDREEIVPQAVADYLPDSVGFQECEGTWYLTLKTYLPDYQIIGVGRLTGVPLLGESTAIMFRKDKYELVDWGTFWLSETPDKVSVGWDAKYHRTCTWAVLKNKETGECYAHVNTHLDNTGTEARIKGLELVMEKAASFDMPVVVTGDFNFIKGSQYYKKLVSDGLTDVSSIADEADTGGTVHDYKGGTDGNILDYICVNDRITRVKAYRIMREKYNDRYVSDHYPIYADMVF